MPVKLGPNENTKEMSKDGVLTTNSMVVKQLSCGAVVEIHGSEDGIEVLTFALGPNNKRMCIGRRTFTERDLTG
jgi:hypothetical protein